MKYLLVLGETIMNRVKSLSKYIVLKILFIGIIGAQTISCSSNGNDDDVTSSMKSADTDIQSSGCGGCFDSSTPVLSKDTLFFNSQGGIDNVILFQSNWDFPPLNSFRSNFNDNFGDCELIPANYNLIEDGVMKTVENDYCKDNYCYARKIFGWITPSGWLSTRSIPPFPCGDGCPYETCECHEDWFVGENLVLALSVNPGAAVHSVPVMKAECSWYSVAHANEESLLVSVGKNETGKSRSIYVHIAVSYTRNVGLTIIQEAE